MYGEDPREPPFDYDYQPQPEPRKRYGGYVIGALAVIMFVGGIWIAYRQGVQRNVPAQPPLIKAEQGPTKVPPANPGGMRVPNQDKTIYNDMGQTAATGQPVERLLPPPEQPQNPPPASAAPASPAPAAAASSGTAAPPASPPPAAAAAPVQSTPPPAAPANPAVAAAPPQPAAQPAPQPIPPQPAPQPAPEPTARPAAPKPAAAPPARHLAAAPAAEAGQVRIQLGAYRDQGAAHRDWLRLSKRYPDLLRRLHPYVSKVDLGSRGTFQRLQAGPLKSREEAAALCARLKAQKQGCIIVGR